MSILCQEAQSRSRPAARHANDQAYESCCWGQDEQVSRQVNGYPGLVDICGAMSVLYCAGHAVECFASEEMLQGQRSSNCDIAKLP
jgi:hypothetical protein